MSSLAHPISAPNSSVAAPTIVTTSLASDDRLNIGADLTIKYTPAVTMVAAWISAETGVGPSIASSSQDCRGACALLPQAPSSSNSPMAVRVPLCAPGALANTAENDTAPNVVNINMMANDSPTAPTRL